MRSSHLVVLPAFAVGALLGTALAGGAPAAADAIDDAWPYGVVLPTDIPGNAGTPTNVESYLFGLGTQQDVTYFHDFAYTNPWYTAHQDILSVPWLFSNTQTTVTGILDGSADIPNAGATFDTFAGLVIPVLYGGVQQFPLFTSYSIDDPELGTANLSALLGGLLVQNLYLSTDAGMKDVLTIFGQDYTLFTTLASDPGDVAAVDPGFQQLLDALAELAPNAGALMTAW